MRLPHRTSLLALALLLAGLSGAAPDFALAGPAEPAEPADKEPIGASLSAFFDSKFIADVADPDGELVEVNLPGALLQGLARGMAEEEPGTAKALGGLTGVNALVVTVKADKVEEAHRRVRALSEELVAKGWSPIARVRDKSSTVTVLTGARAGDGRIDGLVVLVFDREDRELVVCHLAGKFDLSQLGKIAESLDIPGLDAVGGSARQP